MSCRHSVPWWEGVLANSEGQIQLAMGWVASHTVHTSSHNARKRLSNWNNKAGCDANAVLQRLACNRWAQQLQLKDSEYSEWLGCSSTDVLFGEVGNDGTAHKLHGHQLIENKATNEHQTANLLL